MGTCNQSAEEIKDDLRKFLIETSSGRGDITAEAIAEAWNKLSKEEEWGDYLKAYNNWD